MGEDIAIVGIGCRFPGARNTDELWRNILHGVVSRTPLSVEELRGSDVPAAVYTSPDYVPAGFFVDGVDEFDADYFGMSAPEAAMTDPHIRLFLECADTALTDAGHASPESGREGIGVFAGSRNNGYSARAARDPRLRDLFDPFMFEASGGVDYLAPTVAYRLGAEGPALNVATACSTSLAAVHLACASLTARECELALAGGVNLRLEPRRGYRWRPGGVESRTGHCRPLEARADGTVFSEGSGVVALRRLADAMADGDRVYAVIRASALNSDGPRRFNFLTPGVEGQAELARRVLDEAAVHPAEIGYLECHGAGTPVGDLVEVEAMTTAFRETGTTDTGHCPIGSVKSNIGHAGKAAGIAGLIKAALAVHHGSIPPHPDFRQVNPDLSLESSPFRVSTEPEEWPVPNGPRRAMLNGFGLGGGNAHLLLEQAPERAATESRRPWHLLPVTGHTPQALDEAEGRLTDHMGGHPEQDPADVAHSLWSGRAHHRHRRALLVSSGPAGTGPQRIGADDHTPLGEARRERPEIAFLFPGLSGHHVNMGRELYETEPAFRTRLDECAEALAPHGRSDVRNALYPAPGQEETARELLARTRVAQPALFAVECATAALWSSWGIRPDVVVGHSLGEFAAAVVSGVLDMERAAELVAVRASLMDRLPPGRMAAVAAPVERVREALRGSVGIAAVNGPELVVVSGPPEQVDGVCADLDDAGFDSRALTMPHAFHSPMIDPILAPFGDRLEGLEVRNPNCRYVSGLTGRRVEGRELAAPDYWIRHARETVVFDQAVRSVLETATVVLEAGPGRTLVELVRAVCADAGRASPEAVTSMGPESDLRAALSGLGRLWELGAEPDRSALTRGERRVRVWLPPYPYQVRRHWCGVDDATGRELS
ncbi:polyketide synthase [Glycomyces fuscus]|nr:polyketide synthase [Glycomyces fuscus]